MNKQNVRMSKYKKKKKNTNIEEAEKMRRTRLKMGIIKFGASGITSFRVI